MIRTTKHTLKFATERKKQLIINLFFLYGEYLQKTIDLLWENKIPLKTFLSSKDINWMDDLGGQYKALIYKQASGIVRGVKNKKGKKTKPEVKNFTIDLDKRMIQMEESNNSFGKWIRLKLPFVEEGKIWERIELLLPIKEHKQSLKFKDWKVAKTIKLSKTYIGFTFEKEAEPIKTKGKSLGVDCGYKKLLVTSEGQVVGKEIEKIYEKIARKKQRSNTFKKALAERNNKINEIINKEVNLSGIKELVCEDLKNVKHKSKGKIKKQFSSKLQRWSYPKVMSKLERLCEENRVLFTKVDPAYTSQTCSACGVIDKSNRKGEIYQCACGNLMDADHNAAINILHRGVYSPSTVRN